MTFPPFDAKMIAVIIEKDIEEDSIRSLKVTASRCGWKTGTSRRSGKITSEFQTEPLHGGAVDSDGIPPLPGTV